MSAARRASCIFIFTESADPDALFARGTHVGRYLILAVVGVGGSSVVYSAYDPAIDRRVALKILHRQVSASDQMQAWFTHEARLLGRMQHANVLPVFDVGTFGDQRSFIVTPLIEGVTLRRWLKDQHTQSQILSIFARAAEALHAAHEAEIIHRDFKPENVLIDESGHVYVTDFGLATQLRPNEPGVRVGTECYMSPEQAARKAIDARSDQYTYCAVLFEALTGQMPPRTPAIALLDRPLRDARVPGWLKRLLLRGLDPVAERRHDSLAQIAKHLTRDRKRLWLSAAAVITVTLVFGGVMSLQREHSVELCRDAEAAMKNTVRAETLAALTTTLGPLGNTHSLLVVLDNYANRWLMKKKQLCDAALAKGNAGADQLKAQLACLGQKRVELDAATKFLLAQGRETAQEQRLEVFHRLKPVDSCDDPALDQGRGPVAEALRGAARSDPGAPAYRAPCRGPRSGDRAR